MSIFKTLNSELIIQNSELIPHLPGIYKMFGADDELLYVGKARDIAARLNQYKDITRLEPHKQIMMGLTTRVEWEITDTESDALVLEEKLIKSEKPKYNIMMTDGKMYPCLSITKHKFPRIEKIRTRTPNGRDTFGPYPSVGALNNALRTIQCVCRLRTCTDGFMRNRTRPCLLYQIGRCSGPCTNEVPNYANDVLMARRILTGHISEITEELSNEMMGASDSLDFETAAKIRDRISALATTASRGVRQKTPINFSNGFKELEKMLGIKINRVAVFDNSHLFGKSPVGSAIVFDKNGFIKSEYKHFLLRDKSRAGNDIAMMDEFLERATKYKNFDFIIVDGGRAQWNVAQKYNIPTMGVVKGVVRNGDEHFIMPDGSENFDVPKDSELFLMLRRVRDEAHRFAISFHKKKRDAKMLASRLDEIEGIGPSRKRALLHHFGTVGNIADANLVALERVNGLGKSAAKKIYEFFH